MTKRASSKEGGWTDWLIHIVIVAIVVAGFVIPYALKAAKDFAGWEPPAVVQSVVDMLPAPW